MVIVCPLSFGGPAASPKSRTLTRPEPLIMMFAGLRSRWMMPAE